MQLVSCDVGTSGFHLALNIMFLFQEKPKLISMLNSCGFAYVGSNVSLFCVFMNQKLMKTSAVTSLNQGQNLG